MVESQPSTVEDLKTFNSVRFTALFKAVSENPDRIDIDTWVALLHEIINMFMVMGSAMAMAFSDITSKAQIIALNKETMISRHGLQNPTLQEVIEKEIELGVIMLNGENNHK